MTAISLRGPVCLATVLFLCWGTTGLAQEKNPTPVVVAPVRLVNEAPKSIYTGFLEPLEPTQITAVEPGFVRHIAKRGGESVREGEVLAVLSNPALALDLGVLEAQVQEAAAVLEQAQLRLRRLQTLYERQLATAEQFENEQAEMAVSHARMQTTVAMRDRLRERLKLLVVRAAGAGQIVSAELEMGEWITPNRPIYRIADFRRIELRIGVPARYVHTVPRGAAVDVIVPEIDATLKGRVRAVVPHVDAESGNFVVRVTVDNPRRLPLSGLLAQADLPVGSSREVKVVPRDAIVRRGEATQVVVVRENAAQIVPVTVEGNLDNAVIVAAADLKAAESVVVRGNERLFPGMPVAIQEPATPEAGSGSK